MTKFFTAIMAVAGVFLLAGAGTAQDTDEVARLKREIELLKKENDLLKRENELLKKENEQVKKGGKAAKGDEKSDGPFEAATAWEGKRFATGGPTQAFGMRITSRDKDKIKGEIDITRADGKLSTYAFDGTVRGMNIQFKTEKSGFFQQTFTGKYDGKKVALTWNGTSEQGGSVSGTANLEPKLK